MLFSFRRSLIAPIAHNKDPCRGPDCEVSWICRRAHLRIASGVRLGSDFKQHSLVLARGHALFFKTGLPC